MSYSQITLPQTAYFFGGVIGVAFTAGHFQFDHSIFTGAIGLEYNQNVTDWFSYGGIALIDYMTSDAYHVDKDGIRTDAGKFNLGYASLMPVAKFKWYNASHFGMYSKFAAGIGLGFSDSAEFSYAAQISPICMQFGSNTMKGIVEFGYGMQGIVTLGVKKMF